LRDGLIERELMAENNNANFEGSDADVEAGTLYVVSTPIGNLEDITVRALKILAGVDLIAAEDTRHTRKLLARYGISKRLVSCFEQNQPRRVAGLLGHLEKGGSLALVTDSGTPTLSDPGGLIISRALAEGYRVTPIPGPSAAISALSVSGIPFSSFVFEGFLPSKKGRRKQRLQALASEPRPLVFYEAPHRLLAVLNDMKDILGARQAVVAKEMTKRYERFFRGELPEIIESLSARDVKGEYTIIVHGAAEAEESEEPFDEELREAIMEQGKSLKEASAQIAAARNLPRRTVYQEAVRLKRTRKTPESE